MKKDDGLRMEELHFNCPAYLAQRFWLLCAERKETPGQILREFMMQEIQKTDSNFEFKLKSSTGFDAWAIREGQQNRDQKSA
jgi:hypothetical protein